MNEPLRDASTSEHLCATLGITTKRPQGQRLHRSPQGLERPVSEVPLMAHASQPRTPSATYSKVPA